MTDNESLYTITFISFKGKKMKLTLNLCSSTTREHLTRTSNVTIETNVIVETTNLKENYLTCNSNSEHNTSHK